MLKINIKKPISAGTFFLLVSSILVAAVMVSMNFNIPIGALNSGGGIASSAGYSNNASMGETATGKAESASYKSSVGNISQMAIIIKNIPAPDLGDVFVYPNPYKPGTGGQFDADSIMFKNLTTEATIKVFNIVGELVATIEKYDTTADYYEWDATNDAGEKLASGVYIYYVTNPDGEVAKGKFAIIK